MSSIRYRCAWALGFTLSLPAMLGATYVLLDQTTLEDAGVREASSARRADNRSHSPQRRRSVIPDPGRAAAQDQAMLEPDPTLSADERHPAIATAQHAEMGGTHATIGARYWELAPVLLEEMLHAQGKDRAARVWQRQVEAEVVAIKDELASAGTVVTSVDCRASLCRVRFRHADRGSYQRFLGQLLEHGPWSWEGSDVHAGARPSLNAAATGAGAAIESYVYFTSAGDRETFSGLRRRMIGMVDRSDWKSGSSRT